MFKKDFHLPFISILLGLSIIFSLFFFNNRYALAKNINCDEPNLKQNEQLGRKICQTFKDNGLLCVYSGLVCSLDQGKITDCTTGDYSSVIKAVLNSLSRYERECATIQTTDPGTGATIGGCIGYDYAIKNIYKYCYQIDTDNGGIPSLNNILNQQNQLGSYYQDVFGGALKGDDEKCLLNNVSSPCALEPNWDWLNPINGIVGGFFFALYYILRGLLVVSLKAFEWLLNPQNYHGYINFLGTNVVPTLFNYFRDLTYLGLILGGIVIAISTIIGNEKFSWQKLLPKLIIVALLVNFALVICGIFVDVSNYLSTSFFYLGTSTYQGLNITLSNLVVNCTLCPIVKSFYDLPGNWIGGTSAWSLTRASGLGIILAALILFQFGGLLFYLAQRIITIIICLITSPLAFLSWAIPGGDKLFEFWRKYFQQAIVILPILAFVFSISMALIVNLASQVATYLTNSSNTGIFIPTLTSAIFIIILAQITRYVANFLGVEQVEKGFQTFKNATLTAGKIALGAAAGFAGAKLMASGSWQNAQKALLGSDNIVKQNIGKWMKTSSDKILIPRYSAIKETAEKEPDNIIRTRLKTSWMLGDQARSAQFLNILANRKKLDLDEKGDLPILIQLIKSGSPLLDRKTLKDNYPQLDKMIDEIEKAKEKAQTAKEKFDISSQQYSDYYKKGIESAFSDSITKPVNELKDINWKIVFNKFNDPTYKDAYLNVLWDYLSAPKYQDISLDHKVTKIATIISMLPESLAITVAKELADKIKNSDYPEKQKILSQFKVRRFLKDYFS